MAKLPEAFVNTVIGVHKEAGEAWLDGFDALIRSCEERWAFRVQEHYALSFNFVAPVVYANGEEAVLKLSVPSIECRRETEVLQLYGGKGMVRLLEAVPEEGILLLERVKPGRTLHTLDDDEKATAIAAGLMKAMRCAAPEQGSFPTTADWADGLKTLRRRFDGGTGPFPERTVGRAEAMFAELHATAGPMQLLHGDLHHGNILSAEREPWLAIDPKGLIGEPEYGVIQFLLNRHPERDIAAVIRRRIDIFSDLLELRKDRVYAYAFCHAMLSSWWCVEDSTEGFEDAVATVELFESLLQER